MEGHTESALRKKTNQMKYTILLYGSQQDFDAMAGKASDTPAWTAQEFAAIGAGSS